jgi:hypothetical protein
MAAKAVEFILKIMHHFGDDSLIKVNCASVSHHQSNRQVEQSNDMII